LAKTPGSWNPERDFGPLRGVRILELAAIGPVPLAATILSDLGATVIRVDRPESKRGTPAPAARFDILGRGRTSVVLDLRHEAGATGLLELAGDADVLIEGLRPGVMERLGLGPDVLCARNPRLIYGRMTGWGQTGPRRDRAGHDINYLALTGSLHAMGYADRPPSPPLNLIADYGGGAMLLAMGVVAALFERDRSGQGQVVDAAMVDGAAMLSAIFHSLRAAGTWTQEREGNLLDGGAHFYRTYETADRRFIAVGAIEPQFYATLLERLGLDPSEWPQLDRTQWPALRARLASVFRSHVLQHWVQVFEGTDACVAPVNTFAEAIDDPHLAGRQTFVEAFGVMQPAPAPRFSRTPGRIGGPPPGA
jgi:alpha-methylacyl-CoA racemase